jgi:hypothetical protein
MQKELRSELVWVIQQEIKARGFFMFLDERIELICGEKYNPHDLQCQSAISRFAAENGWKTVFAGQTVTFAPHDQD